MAKESVKESITITHKLNATGTTNVEEHCIETTDKGNISFDDLFSHFNGEIVDISITTKSEKED